MATAGQILRWRDAVAAGRDIVRAAVANGLDGSVMGSAGFSLFIFLFV
jgi:hypothetical protein